MAGNSSHYDVIVCGVGAMGSATVYHLARRGLRVLGLEHFNIPHDQGSSHGVTRIIRLAYYEHPSYLPLLMRGYELWRDLQQQFGEQLLYITGSVDISDPEEGVFQGSLRSCLEYDLPHEILAGSEVNTRFPGFRLPNKLSAVFQPDGGFLTPERCIVAHVVLAQAQGADIRACEPLLGWEPTANGVRVRTVRGRYEADKLVIAAGAWAAKLVPRLDGIAVPERQVLGWFQPRQPALYMPNRFPVVNMLAEEGRYYALPIHSVPGFKIGRYRHLGETIDPDNFDRDTHPRDEAVLRSFTERYFPEAAGPTMALRTCIFTMTADEHFVLDRLPECPQVVVASPCSGHGFKFSSVIGEIAADLVTQGSSRLDISMFRLERLLEGKKEKAHKKDRKIRVSAKPVTGKPDRQSKKRPAKARKTATRPRSRRRTRR
jgi:sarcosine oxidase